MPWKQRWPCHPHPAHLVPRTFCHSLLGMSPTPGSGQAWRPGLWTGIKVDAVKWQGQPSQIWTQVIWASLPLLCEWVTSATHATQSSQGQESHLCPECGLSGVEFLTATLLLVSHFVLMATLGVATTLSVLQIKQMRLEKGSREPQSPQISGSLAAVPALEGRGPQSQHNGIFPF